MDAAESLLSAEMAARLSRLSVVARKLATLRRVGRRRTRRVGTGVETIDMRPYDLGDDTRRIAWHAYARLEKLLVRLSADEAPLRLLLVVDQSASMDFAAWGDAAGPRGLSKLRQAARIAAGLAAVALGGEDRVALAIGSAGSARAERPVRGRAGLPRILATLDRLAAVGSTDVPAAVRAALDAAPRDRRGVVVILSDLFEPQGILAGAREARRRGNDVAVIEVLAPFETEPPDLSDVDLEDAETGEIVELDDDGRAERFAAALAAHRAAIDEAASTLGAAVIRTTTSDSFESIVARALGAGLVTAGAR
jgi:uncharacterized protein (DUF58 family)